MNCDFTEQISRLIDNELSEEEAGGAGAHLATCAACQRAREDFLRLRGEIKAYVAAPEPVAHEQERQRRALRRIIASEKSPLWRKSVALPVPAFALLLLAVVSLGIWAAFLRPQPVSTKTEQRLERVLHAPAPPAGPPDVRGALDLARFDRGERALLYKSRRTNPGGIEQ